MAAFDFSSSFAGINGALARLGQQNELAHQRTALSALGQKAQAGDYAGAAEAAFAAGDAGTGLGLLKLQQGAKQEADWLKANPGILGGGAAPAAPVALGTPNEIESRFVNTVKGAGLTNPTGLAAVAAYGKAESGFAPQNVNRSWSDPSESGQPGTAGGIMSWRAERLQGLQQFAKERGEAQPSVETQALYLARENPQLLPALQAAKTPQEANQIMANAWRFAGYNRPGGENARREALTTQYAQRFGGQGGAPVAVPPQVAMNEADVQRLEAQQGNPVVDAPAPVQVAQADAPAPGAAEVQGFAIPGADASIANDPRVMNLQRALAGAPERFKPSIQSRLNILVEELKAQRAENAPTANIKEYRQYRQDEQAAGRKPDDFTAWKRSNAAAGATSVNLPPAEREYDKQAAKDFAEMNTGLIKGAQSANTKIATLNRLETLLSDPNIRTGAGAQMALQAARLGKSVFGIETEGLGPAEAVNAIANQFALELRNPSGGAGMPGAMSDRDREFLMQSTPGLERDPNGNKLIIDYMRRVNQRSVEVERLRRDYIKTNKRLDEGFFDKLAEFSERNPLFPEASKAAPSSGAPVNVKSPSDYEKLPSGAQFLDPEGNLRTKR